MLSACKRWAYPFCVDIVLLLNFSHKRHTVIEADLICRSHFSGGGIAHAVEYLVESSELFFCQRLLKGDTELAPLVRKLSRVNITLALVVNHINHRYISFQIQYYREKTA